VISKTVSHTILLIIIIWQSNSAFAVEVKPILGMGFDFGGEKLAEFQYENGDTSSVKSHEGLNLYGGLKIITHQYLETNISVGWKFGSTEQAENGDAEFTRFPIEALFFLREGGHRIGGGISYHKSPKFSCEIDGICDFEAPFKDSLGYIFEYQYMLERNEIMKAGYFLGFRYTKRDYQLKNIDEEIPASGIGFIFGLTF